MRVLIIGSEGNIGRRLAPYLETQGHLVYCVDIKQGVRNGYTLADINNPADLLPAFNEAKPHVVFLLAAMVSRITCEKSPGLAIETNIGGLSNVINLCRHFESRLIFFSTSEVYGNIGGELHEERELNPNNLYGLSKMMGEQLMNYAMDYQGLRGMIVRPFMFYDEDEDRGEHRSAMIRFADDLIHGKLIRVHKRSTRSWMHMKDAVVVLEKLMYEYKYRIINVGSPEITPTKALAEKMCRILGLEYEDKVIEMDLPPQMTLDKTPGLGRMLEFYTPRIDVEMGIVKVINRLQNE